MRRPVRLAVAVAVCIAVPSMIAATYVGTSASGVVMRSTAAVLPLPANTVPLHVAQSFDRLPVAIDGAATPQRIPDALAYRHFLSAVAEGQAPSLEDQQRRAALIDRLKLSPADRAHLLASLRGVRDQLEGIEQQRKQITTEQEDAPATLDALRVRESDVLLATRARIFGGLSPEGAARLSEHVRQHVKRQIKVYGEVPAGF